MSPNNCKEAAIQGLHAYREELLAQINRIQEDLHHVERSIELLGGNGTFGRPTATAQVPNEQRTVITGPKYADIKAQAGVELFLKENPEQWFKSSVIARELIRRGMPKESKAFASTIAGALKRCTKKGIAVREQQDGVFVYRLRDGSKQGGDGNDSTHLIS
jgi:hypothetical protein